MAPVSAVIDPVLIPKTHDAVGNVIARHDYHPFGEEIATSQRTIGLNYSGDGVRKKFTGYERDGETGLDFAEARYLGCALGRFSSPDPLMASGKRGNPQTWNRYVYVLNNPLNIIDPLGLDGERTGAWYRPENLPESEIWHPTWIWDDEMNDDNTVGLTQINDSGLVAFNVETNKWSFLNPITGVDTSFEKIGRASCRERV